MKLYIKWHYKPSRNNELLTFTSDLVDAQVSLSLLQDIEKTGRVKHLELIDEWGKEWTKKELTRYLTEALESPHHIVLYFDGNYNRQANEAGLGIVIYYTQNNKYFRIRKNEKIAEMDSNNEAEYAALWMALQEIETLHTQEFSIQIKGDSQVVINQLSEEWPCYEKNLNRWIDRIEQKMKKLGFRANFTLLPRNQNSEADKLATQALEDNPISSVIELNGPYK
jgi:ribonuclease HI